MELISREEVLKVFGDIHPLDHNANAYKSKIEQLPTIWVEINEPPFGKVYQNSFVTFLSTETYDAVRRKICRPKGKWLKNAIGWKCSQCGRPHIIQDNFCPNCGTKMEDE